jgi:hypothetical protein
MEILERPLVGGFTVMHALIAFAALLVVSTIWSKFGGSGEPPMAEHKITKTCPACHWTGTVSKHVPRCPKCGEKLTA